MLFPAVVKNSVNFSAMPIGSVNVTSLLLICEILTFCLKPVVASLNPFSHGVFFVSRLTAVGHMRHPFKADLGEK
jgi:Ni/Fe-hydrogenase subunit HybB-like protein